MKHRNRLILIGVVLAGVAIGVGITLFSGLTGLPTLASTGSAKVGLNITVATNPSTIHTCPSKYATSTTVSGKITPSLNVPIYLVYWSMTDSKVKALPTPVVPNIATGKFEFKNVGSCAAHGTHFQAYTDIPELDPTKFVRKWSEPTLMKVVGHVDLDLIPGNQNTVRLKTGSKAPISTLVWGGDVASKVRYEARKKDATAWTLVQTCKRGKILARDGDAFKAYKCQFKVPKTPGVYYIRGHFKSSATTAETSTGTYTMTVVK